MFSILITGTAGSGKSFLASRVAQWYNDNGFDTAILNLDTAAVKLPYESDIDVRDYVSIEEIMDKYELGPNGAIVMANDLVATKMDQIQSEIYDRNCEYLVIDTPGQIELFAFRSSGPYFVSNLVTDSITNLFLFDGMLCSSPVNFVSLSLLSISIRLSLKIPQINILTKRDLIIDRVPKILEWSSEQLALEDDLNNEKNSEYALLSKEIINNIYGNGLMEGLIPFSNITMNGIIDISAELTRIINQGEEKKY